MKLWILRPVDGADEWNPWYDKAFGFIVRAETEQEARSIATDNASDEIRPPYGSPDAWKDPAKSTCEELSCEGGAGVVMSDYASA